MVWRDGRAQQTLLGAMVADGSLESYERRNRRCYTSYKSKFSGARALLSLKSSYTRAPQLNCVPQIAKRQIPS